jgi:hypothetical protein
MLDHPDLRPKIVGCMDPTRSDYNPNAQLPAECTGTLDVQRANTKILTDTRVVANTAPGIQVLVPAYASGIELYNLNGKKVWKYSCKPSTRGRLLDLPGSVEKGILKVRPIF